MKTGFNNITDLFDILKSNRSQNILFPPATLDELKKLEGELGVWLPETYRQFLMLTNGADLYQSETIYGTKDGTDGLQINISTARKEVSTLRPNLIPFHFGNIYTCFDVSTLNTREYPILKYTLRGKYIPTVYNSFAQWLDKEIISEYDKV